MAIRSRSPHYFPFGTVFFVVGVLLLGLVATMLQLGAIGYAYERLGVDSRWLLALLLLSLGGSAVNLPLWRMHGGEIVSARRVRVYGVDYVVPEVVDAADTLVTINVGGGLVPLGLSAWLVATRGFGLGGLAALGATTAVCYVVARPVRGVGIVVPALLPPLVAALSANLLAPAHAPMVAYVAGSVGCLVGADVLHLGEVRGLGVPVASIGGAGTFDAIFLTGILAVILA